MKRDPSKIIRRIHEYLVSHFKASINEIAKSQKITWRTARKYLKLLAYIGERPPISEFKVGKRTLFLSADPRSPKRRYPEESDFATYRAKLTVILVSLKKAFEEHRSPEFIESIKAQLVSVIDEYNAKFEKNRHFLYPIPEWVKNLIYQTTYGELGSLIETIMASPHSTLAPELIPLSEKMGMRSLEEVGENHRNITVKMKSYKKRKKEGVKKLLELGTVLLHPTYHEKWEKLVKIGNQDFVFEVEKDGGLLMIFKGNVIASLDPEIRIHSDKLLLHSFVVLRPSIHSSEVDTIVRKIADFFKSEYGIRKIELHSFPGIGSFYTLS